MRTRALPDRHRAQRSVLVITAALCSGVTVWLADAAREHDGPSVYDGTVAHRVVSDRTATLTAVAKALTFAGSEIVIGVLAVLSVVALLVRQRISRAVVFGVAMAGSAALTVAAKLVVGRSRPPSVDRLGPADSSYSFPSGHTLNTLVFLAALVWAIWPSVSPRFRPCLVVLAALVGMGVGASRVYLGYHWLTDVVASVFVGTAWLSVLALAVGLASHGGGTAGIGLRLPGRQHAAASRPAA